MSLLGTLEQFRLPNVLQRLESHEKTGLLVVRQGVQWVEFYVRNGSLLCIGPVRTSATLGDRLLQDKVISQQSWQEVQALLRSDERSETRVAIALMERGYVTREQLRAWATEKSLSVLSAVLAWTSGEVYFEEGTQPPPDRLLVSMSITSLIETANVNVSSPQPQPIQTTSAPSRTGRFRVTEKPVSLSPSSLPSTFPAASASSTLISTKPMSVKSKSDVAHVPTLTDPAQFLGETVSTETGLLSTALLETESFASLFNAKNDSRLKQSLSNTNEISFASFSTANNFSETPPLSQPEPVKNPVPPKRIDTSFMLPDMVLVPADISAQREQNPKVQITPDQWRVLTCVDGRNSLQVACQLLGLLPDVMCVLVGELVAEGLIQVVPAEQVQLQKPSPDARGSSVPDLANAYVPPGYTASSANPWSASVPALSSADLVPNPATALSFETESQWGNGGNGATFVPGRGWITAHQPAQPLHAQGPLTSPHAVYAHSGSSW